MLKYKIVGYKRKLNILPLKYCMCAFVCFTQPAFASLKFKKEEKEEEKASCAVSVAVVPSL